MSCKKNNFKIATPPCPPAASSTPPTFVMLHELDVTELARRAPNGAIDLTLSHLYNCDGATVQIKLPPTEGALNAISGIVGHRYKVALILEGGELDAAAELIERVTGASLPLALHETAEGKVYVEELPEPCLKACEVAPLDATLCHLRCMATSFAQAGYASHVKAIIQQYHVTTVTDLDPVSYGEVYAAMAREWENLTKSYYVFDLKKLEACQLEGEARKFKKRRSKEEVSRDIDSARAAKATALAQAALEGDLAKAAKIVANYSAGIAKLSHMADDFPKLSDLSSMQGWLDASASIRETMRECSNKGLYTSFDLSKKADSFVMANIVNGGEVLASAINVYACRVKPSTADGVAEPPAYILFELDTIDPDTGNHIAVRKLNTKFFKTGSGALQMFKAESVTRATPEQILEYLNAKSEWIHEKQTKN